MSFAIPHRQEVGASRVSLIFFFTVVIFPLLFSLTFSQCFFCLSFWEFSVEGKISLILGGLRWPFLEKDVF